MEKDEKDKEYKELYLQAYDIIWAFRDNYSAYWKTPNQMDCVKYAFSECGELMDATLRLYRKDDARNNTKVIDIGAELADIVIMLISSNDKEYRDIPDVDIGRLDDSSKIVEVCYNVSNYLAVINSNKTKLANSVSAILWSFIAFKSCVDYSKELKIDLVNQIKINLERIKEKHVPKGL